MGDHGFLAGDLSRLRQGAHEFLRRYAARAWEHEHDGARWDITLPPDVAALPAHERFGVHAQQEARRLAQAQLYDVDAEVTVRAVGLGAAILLERHEQAVTLAGHPRVATTLGIDAPAASGFLRWRHRDGIGHNPSGAPVIACHWGPAPGGSWLAWWADGHAMAAGYAAKAQAAGRHISAGSVTQIFGPLWYDHQQLLRPGPDSTRPGAGLPEPGPAASDAGPSSAETGTSGLELLARSIAACTPGLALLYQALATWWLLTCPNAVNLHRQPVPAAVLAADRAAGLRTGPVIIATAARSP
jgi:hypothetical protein